MLGSRRAPALAGLTAVVMLGLAVGAAFPAPPDTAPLFFRALSPCRLLDTGSTGEAIRDGDVRAVGAWGACGIPAAARAVFVSVTVVASSAAGDLQVWGDASEAPATSVLTFQPSATVTAAALVNLDAGVLWVKPRTAPGGSAGVLIDVVGYFEEAAGSSYNAVVPCRIYDTRTAGQPALADAQPRHIPVAGTCQIPGDARAIAAVITVMGATGRGRLDVSGVPDGRPGLPAISFDAGPVRTNGTILALGAGGFEVSPVVAGGGTVHMTIEVAGFYR